MADSPAIRQQRRRLHLSGDHSMCGLRCVPEKRREASTEVADAVAAYLDNSPPTSEHQFVRGAILEAAARAVDRGATPGLLRALDDALRAYRHFEPNT